MRKLKYLSMPAYIYVGSHRLNLLNGNESLFGHDSDRIRRHRFDDAENYTLYT
ncbi:unnamed protein product [Nesidiocoris tenuis]|uniref:Uncharacterized protein n=1 Tax=Nesidiocoris tenuis TaxID=355587 RepID=A0A6H5H8M6_9HEMI|nr:unnamed protein product [Nesidiocoris tenuis]